ncbi:hypothetical protein MMC19_000854 [Ptychographa xylographoides]|nr:hypothetical protein [Ptychographa xylographoides]
MESPLPQPEEERVIPVSFDPPHLPQTSGTADLHADEPINPHTGINTASSTPKVSTEVGNSTDNALNAAGKATESDGKTRETIALHDRWYNEPFEKLPHGVDVADINNHKQVCRPPSFLSVVWSNHQADILDGKPTRDWRMIHLKAKTHSGTVFSIIGEMDTGADLNFIDLDIVQRYMPMEIDTECVTPEIEVGNGNKFRPYGKLRIPYQAGRDKDFQPEAEFWVVEHLPRHVILGGDLLYRAHLITVDNELENVEAETAPDVPEEPNPLCLNVIVSIRDDKATKEANAKYQVQKAKDRAAKFSGRR